MATQLSPRTRGVVAVIVGMAAAGFVYGISDVLSIGLRAVVTGAVAAVVTLLVILVLPKTRKG